MYVRNKEHSTDKALLYIPVAAAMNNHPHIHTEYFVQTAGHLSILHATVFGVLDNQPRQPESQSQADRVYILDYRENKEMEILRIYFYLSG